MSKLGICFLITIGRKGEMPIGHDFLCEVPENELIELYKKERDGKAKLRLLACIHRKGGKTYQKISDLLVYPLMTIHDWLCRIHTDGLPNRYDNKQLGAPRKLSDDQRKHLEDILEQPPTVVDIPSVIWTNKLIRYYVAKEFNVEYSSSQIGKILRALGFTAQKPRPEHKKANRELQEAFKKT